MFQIHTRYLTLAFIIFLTEVVITLFVHDHILRPYGGDFLVVMMLYCLVRGVSGMKVEITAAVM